MTDIIINTMLKKCTKQELEHHALSGNTEVAKAAKAMLEAFVEAPSEAPVESVQEELEAPAPTLPVEEEKPTEQAVDASKEAPVKASGRGRKKTN